MKYLLLFSICLSGVMLRAQSMRVDAQAFATYAQSMQTAGTAAAAASGSAMVLNVPAAPTCTMQAAAAVQPATVNCGVVVQEELVAGRHGRILKDGVKRDAQKPGRRPAKPGKG